MIIDAHVHFYDSPRPGNHPTPVSDHLAFHEVLSEARASGVDKIVQVTPYAMGYDNDFSFAMAERHPDDVLGVIARLDPAAPETIDRLASLMRHSKMLALRLTLIEKERVGWLATGELDGFFARAEQLRVPIELFAPFRVLDMHATVRRFPGIPWLIGHMGLRHYAGMENKEPFGQWPQLLALAREPNVWIKCSYFPEAAKDLEAYPYRIARDHFLRLYEHAGPDRLVWGSDFPNVRRTCTYRQAVDFMRVECDFLAPTEREAIMASNFLRYVSR
jgi:predicted TIM-barrel fold metal-dependent hydrolase